MSDASPPPKYDPSWTPPSGHCQNHITPNTTNPASATPAAAGAVATTAAAAAASSSSNTSLTNHQVVPLLPESEEANDGNDELESSQSQGLLSYYSALESFPDTPSSPVPLILLPNGDSGYQIFRPDQLETRPVSPSTPPASQLDDQGLPQSSATSSSTSSTTSTTGSLSSPPSYPDSPPSYPDSPPSYPHSPPGYPKDRPPPGYPIPYHLYHFPLPREVSCRITMTSSVAASSSNQNMAPEQGAVGSHTSLTQPLGSGHSLTQPANNTGEGSRSSLNHPVVVRTGSKNSLERGQPVGSKNNLNHPINRRASTRHSFHHAPSHQPGRVTASQLMRTSSTHAPRTSPLYRDRSSTNESNRSLSPSIPFYPHNLPGTRSASWNDLDPAASGGTQQDGTGSGQVTLILQDINPDSTAIYLTHVNHPSTCQLIDPNELETILLAEGQRDIDQFEDKDGPRKRRMRLRNVCLVFWSLTCHLGFFICIGLIAWQVTLKRQTDIEYNAWAKRPDKDERGPKPIPLHSEALLIVASVLLVLCYVFSWVESCLSDTHRYIDHKMELTKCRLYVRRMRMTVPKLKWTIDCYHWSSEDAAARNSGDKPQHEKLITHTEVEEFPFSVCKDASGDLGTFKKSGINRFEFEKTFGFVDQSTADLYEQRKEAFMQRNMFMDKHYSFKEIFELDGMESHMTVFVERGHLTKLMSFQLYSCLACCLLTWPYRILFRLFTKKRKFTFVKLLGL